MITKAQGTRRTALLTLAALFLAGATLTAQKPRLTPQALWSMKRLGNPALSPDGKTVAFTVQEWSIDKNKSTTNLWLADVATGATRRLTAAAAPDGAPEWDPRGKRLAFTSKRGEDESASLYVMAVDGGEPQKVLELPYAVSGPRWMPDGQGIVVSTSVIPELAGALAKADLAATAKEIKRRKDSRVTAKVTEHRQYRYLTSTRRSWRRPARATGGTWRPGCSAIPIASSASSTTPGSTTPTASSRPTCPTASRR